VDDNADQDDNKPKKDYKASVLIYNGGKYWKLHFVS
jgi:hypothetical protein